MILLRTVPPLGQAGVKRLHPTWRRIRRHKQRREPLALLNKQDFSLSFDFTALPFLKSRRLHDPGLSFKPMFAWGICNPHLIATERSGTCAFPVATATSQSLHLEPQLPVGFLTRKKLHREMLATARKSWNRSGCSSRFLAVPLSSPTVPNTLCGKSLAHVRALHAPSFFHVARQPQ